jgi:hypothetical protein
MGPVDTRVYYVSRADGCDAGGFAGVGKTTTAGKLARYMRDKNNKKPLFGCQ